MKHNIYWIVVLAGFLINCQTSQKKAAEKSEKAWGESMQGLARDVYDLIPFVYNREAYANRENRAAISEHLARLSHDSHEISSEMGKTILGNDPLVDFSITSMKQDLQRAASSFEAGHIEYSRNTIKTAMGHCFRCHSVAKEGSSAAWPMDEIQSLKLAPAEKVDLFVAGRKFNQAIQLSESALKDPQFLSERPFEYEELLRKYVAVVARWADQPNKAKEILQWAEKQEGLPGYLRGQIQVWRGSLASWSKDKTDLKKMNSSQLLQKGKQNLKIAESKKDFKQDHAGDVDYLRATAALHEALRHDIKPADRGEVLFLLGVAYEHLDELGAWNLHDLYFEQCIRQLPQTARAKTCYKRLEASLFFGYSGSGGVHLPPYERQRLKDLRGLAGI